MEKIGLINFINTLDNVELFHNQTIESKAFKQEDLSLSRLHTELINIGRSKDIDNILGAERYLIRLELNRCPDNEFYKAVRSSLSTAVNDLDQAAEILKMVKNPLEYKIFNRGVSQKDIDRKNGLPRDAFHRFVDSNKTRLGNRIISTDATGFQRKVLIERHSYMNIIKQEYMKLQSKALDIPILQKSKELTK